MFWGLPWGAGSPWGVQGAGPSGDNAARFGGFLLLDPAAGAPFADLRAMALASLFTWRLEVDGDAVDVDTVLRGWWADAYQADQFQIGSRLWLLYKAPINDETLERGREYIEEALAWMVSEAFADSVSAELEHSGPGRVDAAVTIRRGDSEIQLPFVDLWADLARAIDG